MAPIKQEPLSCDKGSLNDSSCWPRTRAIRIGESPRSRLNQGGKNGWPDDPVQSARLASARRPTASPATKRGGSITTGASQRNKGGDLRLATPSPVLAANEPYGFTPSLFNHLRSRPLAL